jgi:hypothetical protein
MPRVEFDSTKKPLEDLLKLARDGLLQLPDFQRGWVWDDDGLRSLLASISSSFPVGAAMTLQAGGDVRFKPRPIEGAPAAASAVNPDALLLDGQQRITSLYQTTMRRDAVETINHKKQKIRRFYYFDMRAALDASADRMEAIVGVPESKIETRDFGREVVRDLTTPESEYAAMMFPVNQIFDANNWMMGFMAHWGYEKEQSEFWFKFQQEVLNAFHHYQMPIIVLSKQTSREAVCVVFEKVNTGGKKLDAFELLTAIYAGEEEGFHLRERWDGIRKGLAGAVALKDHPVTRLEPTDFFQALALLWTHGRRREHLAKNLSGDAPAVSCTRDTVLRVPLAAFHSDAKRLEAAFVRTAKFLHLRRIYWFKDLPYRSQLVPLTAIMAELGERANEGDVRDKLTQWYWCGVFGELYGGAVETRFAKDLSETLAWIDGGPTPSTVRDSGFRAERLDTLTSRLSAAYKGVHALLMAKGARDFRSGQECDQSTYFGEVIDIHHVFPRAWCEHHGIERKRFDTILNKTPLSAATNKIIGGVAPSVYLTRLESKGAGAASTIDGHIISHLIAPDLLRADDFDAAIEARREALIGLIEKATGKKVFRGDASGEEPAEDPVPVDEDEADAV